MSSRGRCLLTLLCALGACSGSQPAGPGSAAGGAAPAGREVGAGPSGSGAPASVPTGGRAPLAVAGTGAPAGRGGIPASTAGRAGAGTSAAGSGSGSAGNAASSGNALSWPNDQSRANSDPWLATNHDNISQLRPRVLVIDLENTATDRAMGLIDKHIAALSEASSFHKYSDPNAQPALVYELVKIARAPKRVDYPSWNTQEFADTNLQLKDPADPNGPNLTLCGLFEKGVINEVWCMASSDPKCGETQEYKQVYDESGKQVPNKFANVSNGDNISSLGCKVTARITDFNSARGAGCHQHAMGHAWERYMDGGAVPQLGKQARRFLNWDLDQRAGAPFSSFYGACRSNGMQLTDCIVWASETRAQSGPSAAKTFDIADMSDGCGNAHFYANTTGTYSYDANMPDPMVSTSCEHYGMHDGPDGKDLKTAYTNAMTDMLYGRSQRECPADQPACDDDCGGHGTTYLYQNFPGPGTTAKADDGSAMRNWWVYLFY